MIKQIRKYVIPIVCIILILGGCRKWEDHTEIKDAGVGLNLLERIKNDPNLRKFTEMLTRSGYADTIASTRAYTVFAPTNDALAPMFDTLINNEAALKSFVANHIAFQAYFTTDIQSMQRIPVLNGKYHNLTASAVDDAAISVKDLAAKNGVVQVLGTALMVLNNTWQFAETDSRMPALQKKLMVDSIGGLFRSRVYNLQDESKNFTLFVLQDAAWEAEVNKLKPYTNVPGNVDSTTKVSGWMVVKDLAVDVLYRSVAEIPDTVVSPFGVRVGIDKAAVVATIKTSNGVVYVMNKLEVPLRDKFPDIIVEAENYTAASASRLANTYFRDKRDSATGGVFRDVLVYNHGLAQFNLRYKLTEVPSMKYRAYWMALNDNINGMTAPFSQKIGVDSFNSVVPAYAVVQMNTYSEQFAGEFTLTRYRPTFNLYLTAANNTTANTNALVCNYIRLIPVF